MSTVDQKTAVFDILPLSYPRHLELVRSKPCAVSSRHCWGDIVVCHLLPVGNRGIRHKQSYRHFATVPLCVGHHGEQEGNTAAFNLKHGTDLALYAMQLMIETLTGVEACWHRDRQENG